MRLASLNVLGSSNTDPWSAVVGPIGIERLIVMNPETIHKLMVTDWVDYPRVSLFQKINRTRSRSRLPQPKFMRDVLGFATGYGLLTVTGNEHKQMRKTMNPAFSLPNLVARESALLVLRCSQALIHFCL